MADIDLSGQLTSIAWGQNTARDVARARSGSQVAPPQRPTPAPVTETPTTVPLTVAADVLLAAQEARQVARPRGFDARAALDAYGNASQQPQQATPAGATDDAADRATVEVLPPGRPGDNVIALFDVGASAANGPQGSAAGGGSGSVRAEFSRANQGDVSAQPKVQGSVRTEFSRANQAYVGAGAADSQLFAHSGVDSSARQANRSFDILI